MRMTKYAKLWVRSVLLLFSTNFYYLKVSVSHKQLGQVEWFGTADKSVKRGTLSDFLVKSAAGQTVQVCFM